MKPTVLVGILANSSPAGIRFFFVFELPGQFSMQREDLSVKPQQGRVDIFSKIHYFTRPKNIES